MKEILEQLKELARRVNEIEAKERKKISPPVKIDDYVIANILDFRFQPYIDIRKWLEVK